MSHKILAVNPGSTSTKVGVFSGEEALLIKNIEHDAAKLAQFSSTGEQLNYRLETILKVLADNGFTLADADAFVGRGGGLWPVDGGVYPVSDLLLDHATREINGVHHPASLGPQLAHDFAVKYGKPAFVVNPPDTDELCSLARITGVEGVYRTVHLHALNLKETAIRHSAARGLRYEDANYVVCHIGGGISISAHEKGRMIDGNDIVGGEGPMAPTRCGALPAAALIKLCYAGQDVKEVKSLCTHTGGFVSLLGTSDAKEVNARAANGDTKALLIWNAMLYQIGKFIGEMAVALEGKVDGILLGGGMVHNAELVEYIKKTCSWIAPVFAYPGEFEMEALAAGALRALTGKEQLKEYSGVPIWQPAMLADYKGGK